jgi:penicillin amidase
VHLVVANPAINAYGVAIAGAPSIHLGTNGHAAWSFTNYMSDVGDLYRETIDPDDEDAVMFNGASVPLAIRTERILVRPIGGAVADAVATEFRVAVVPHHGPILNDVLPDPLPLLLADAPISYRWSGYDTALAPRALARLLDVRDFAQFAEVLRDMHIGAQNSVFADRDGHIGYIAPGRFPLRSWDLHAHPPITPLPGAGGFEWDGYRDYDTLPRLLDPAWGFIGTANNDPNGQMADGDPFGPETFFGYNYDVGFRAHRIQVRLHEALAARAVTLADMESLQIDVYVEFADMLVPRMLTAAARRLTEVTTQGLNAAVATLAAWDRRATIESAGAAVFHQTVVRLISDFVAQPLLPPLRPMILGNPQYALRAVVRAIRSDDHHFFPQGADRAIVAALATARDDLAAFFGSSDPSAWHWGDMHVRKLTHVLGEAYGLGPIPAPGGFDVINRADFDYLDENGPEPLPYRIVDGPDMRMIVEVAGPDTRIRMMLPHGSSGDPASDHYDDQFALWVAGEYRDAAYSPAAVEASKRSEVTLR